MEHASAVKRDSVLADGERKRALVAMLIASFLTTFMTSALNLSIPSLEIYYDATASAISWVVSSYTMFIAAMSLPFGRLADSVGHRPVFLLGVLGFGITSVACVFSQALGFMIFFRALQGASAAMMFATNNSILISIYPQEVRGRMLGLSTAATYIGLTTGPIVGGFLDAHLGWQAVFIAGILFTIVTFALSFRAVPKDGRRPEAAQKGSVDIAGIGLYIAMILLSLYGLTNFAAINPAKLLFAGGLAIGVIFILIEKRATNPVLRVSLFTENRIFLFSGLAALLNYSATYAISYGLSLYLQLVKGMPADRAGIVLIAMPIVQAIFSPRMGALSDRIRPSVLASTGMGLDVLALFAMSRMTEDTSLIFLIAALAVAGLGIAMFVSPNTNAMMNCVAKDEYGVANSIIATMRTYGQSSGMAIFNIVTILVLGSGSLEQASAGAMVHLISAAFLVFAVVCAVGLFFSLAREKK